MTEPTPKSHDYEVMLTNLENGKRKVLGWFRLPKADPVEMDLHFEFDMTSGAALGSVRNMTREELDRFESDFDRAMGHGDD